jgi:DNA invertase Pin-like site-specific DNA recombinase
MAARVTPLIRSEAQVVIEIAAQPPVLINRGPSSQGPGLPEADAEIFARMEVILRRIEATPSRLLERMEARLALVTAATAAYYRVSDGRQADKYGPSAQRRDIARRVDANKWRAPSLEYEDHITATGKVLRTDFIKMRADARAGKFKVLLVGRVDRFARNQLMGWLYIYELIAAGVYVYFCNEDIIAGLDLGWKDGASEKLKLAENYVKVLTENINRSVIEREAAGIHVGQPPYGWRSGRGGTYYELVPECEPGIRRAFELALEDRLKVASIAAALNREGLRWKGELFDKSRVHSILTESGGQRLLAHSEGRSHWPQAR